VKYTNGLQKRTPRLKIAAASKEPKETNQNYSTM